MDVLFFQSAHGGGAETIRSPPRGPKLSWPLLPGHNYVFFLFQNYPLPIMAITNSPRRPNFRGLRYSGPNGALAFASQIVAITNYGNYQFPSPLFCLKKPTKNLHLKAALEMAAPKAAFGIRTLVIRTTLGKLVFERSTQCGKRNPKFFETFGSVQALLLKLTNFV